MNHSNDRPVRSSLMKFASLLSAIATIFAAPQIAKYLHAPTVNYLSTTFDYKIAHIGGWVVVVLLICCIYFGNLPHKSSMPMKKGSMN